MSRIDRCFTRAKEENRAALVCFTTAGDPDAATSYRWVLAMVEKGADLIELGMPYSDPMADGPVIQRASKRALDAGMNLKSVLRLVAKLRTKTDIPILLMGYWNPILAYGPERFVRDLARAKGDAVLIVDLPPEESGEFQRALRRHHLHQIFLVAPTTTESRVERIAQMATGFIYYISLEGVTGAKVGSLSVLRDRLAQVRKGSTVPIAVGFGIRQAREAKAVAQMADGVVIGSVLIEALEKSRFDRHFKSSRALVGAFKTALKKR